MKSRIFTLFLCFVTAIALIGCGGGGSSSGGATTGVIQGSVKDTAGTGIVGATIVSASETKTSGTGGYYEIIAPLGRAKIEVSATNYVKSATFVDVSGTVAANVVMRTIAGVQSTQTLANADTTATTATNNARAANNAYIDFPAGSIVDAAGNAVADVKVEIANSVKADTGYADAFPGYFLGTTNGGEAKPIESFGYLDVNLYANDGTTKLQLGENKTADIYIPVNPDPGAGVTTIPLWRLNEENGIWENKGTATRVGATSVFKATVSTFSTYNLDKEFEGGIPLTVTVYEGTPVHEFYQETTPTTSTAAPTPISGALVKVDINNTTTGLTTGSAWQGRGVTGSDGKVTIAGVPGGNLTVTAEKADKTGTAWSYTVENGSATSEVYFGSEDR